MDKQVFINFIKANIPNIPVNDHSVDQIIEAFEESSFDKGEFLLKQGKVSGYFVLLEGYMRAYTFNDLGEEVTTTFYSAKRVVFEAASFFLHQPSSENIVALSNCRGFYTNFDKLNQLFHVVPEFREFGRAILVNEFVNHKKQKLDFINKSAEERYLNLLTEDGNLFQHAQLRHIASWLGITDTSLSRIRRDVVKK